MKTPTQPKNYYIPLFENEKVLLAEILKHLPNLDDEGKFEAHSAIRLFSDLRLASERRSSFKKVKNQVVTLQGHASALLKAIQELDMSLIISITVNAEKQFEPMDSLEKIEESLSELIPCLDNVEDWIWIPTKKTMMAEALRYFVIDLASIFERATGDNVLDHVNPGDAKSHTLYYGKFIDMVDDCLRVAKWPRKGSRDTLGDYVREIILLFIDEGKVANEAELSARLRKSIA